MTEIINSVEGFFLVKDELDPDVHHMTASEMDRILNINREDISLSSIQLLRLWSVDRHIVKLL